MQLVEDGIHQKYGNWADIGAGTGIYTEILRELIPDGVIYAVDKNPHMLWRLMKTSPTKLIIEDTDFTRPMKLPEMGGMVMANALHCTSNHLETLKNVLQHLAIGGRFILIEYDVEVSSSPWIPFPISMEKFGSITNELGLSQPKLIGHAPSPCGTEMVYSVWCEKLIE